MSQGAVVLAQSAEDVATVVKHAQKYKIDIATCGGGHSVSGASSSNGGIVVDLSEMQRVIVDPFPMIITVQGGCVWADVDRKAAEYGLATVGGTVNHTGVGGLTLGGGYGWLSGEHGLAIDNLVSIQMVLADGSITTANAMKNTDLFWAVRGAGTAFGIATEFTFRAHRQRETVFAGQLGFIPPQLPQIVEYINNGYLKTSAKTSITVVFAVAPPPIAQPCIVAALFHNGSEEEAREVFKPLFDLQPVMNMTSMMPYSSVNSMLNPVTGHGGRKSMKGAPFVSPMRPAFAHELFAEFTRFVTETPDMAESLVILECRHHDKICEVSNSATAFAGRGEENIAVLLSKGRDPANDALGRQQVRKMAAMFATEMQHRKQSGQVHMKMESPGSYCNYEGEGDNAQAVYGPNTARLLALKAKYDPHHIFNKTLLQMPLLK